MMASARKAQEASDGKEGLTSVMDSRLMPRSCMADNDGDGKVSLGELLRIFPHVKDQPSPTGEGAKWALGDDPNDQHHPVRTGARAQSWSACVNFTAARGSCSNEAAPARGGPGPSRRGRR
jgi:hypothetical protein